MDFNRRQERVNDLMQEELSRIILEDLEVEPGVLVTVTKVEVATDMITVRVHISVFPKKRLGYVLGLLKRKNRMYGTMLADRMKRGRCIELHYRVDERLEKQEKMESVLDEVKNF
jgi:ribosome-binding factor A